MKSCRKIYKSGIFYLCWDKFCLKENRSLFITIQRSHTQQQQQQQQQQKRHTHTICGYLVFIHESLIPIKVNMITTDVKVAWKNCWIKLI